MSTVVRSVAAPTPAASTFEGTWQRQLYRTGMTLLGEALTATEAEDREKSLANAARLAGRLIHANTDDYGRAADVTQRLALAMASKLHGDVSRVRASQAVGAHDDATARWHQINARINYTAAQDQLSGIHAPLVAYEITDASATNEASLGSRARETMLRLSAAWTLARMQPAERSNIVHIDIPSDLSPLSASSVGGGTQQSHVQIPA